MNHLLIDLSSYLRSLPAEKGYPSWDEQTERLEFWLGDHLVMVVPIEDLEALGDEWPQAIVMAEQRLYGRYLH